MKISKKKPHYPIQTALTEYLDRYNRTISLPVKYEDLTRYHDSYHLLDKNGNNTLWDTLIYDEYTNLEIKEGLTMIYSLLKTEGDIEITKHLQAERIDFCHFGNSNPFRVKIVNLLNDNYDYMYVKKADASRVFGLELEHLLSPNFISYLVDGTTLVEEHIAGIPGDQFISGYMKSSENFNKVRFTKEFTKFNERCFVRLLGDMRSYNYVIDVTPDFEDEQYRIKAIDFDQQSYEGKKRIYLPQYFKENTPIIKMGMEFMNVETTRQYQIEERTLIARRYNMQYERLSALIDCMRKQSISSAEKVIQLCKDLNGYYRTEEFKNCKNMGDVLDLHLRFSLKETEIKLEN